MNHQPIVIDWKEEVKVAEIEGEETMQFIEKWVDEMLPRLQHLQRRMQSGLPLGTLLALQKEVFEGLAIYFMGIPPEYQWMVIDRVAPGWAELVDLTERNRVLAKKLLEKRRAKA